MENKPPQKRSIQEQDPGTSKKKKSVPAISSESPPPPTDARSSDLPHLQTCVESIKALAVNRHLGDGHGEGAGLGLAPLNESPSNCYVLLLAFLCHLKVDQTTLFEAAEQSGHGSELSYNAIKGEVSSPIDGVTGTTTRKLPKCPPMEATPAFRAVLEDTSLFRSLMAILSSKATVSVTGSGTAGNATNKGKEQQLTGMTPPPSPSPFHLAKQGGGAHPGPTNNMSTLSLGPSKSLLHSGGVAGGRKRSLSVSSERSEASVEPVGHNHPQQQNKVPKLLHSPHPSKKASGVAVVGGNVATDSVALLPTDFYPPVFAAVILYTALRHVDHWPAPLVGAFAEDCFGPRLWVDDDRCKPLVENLKLVLKQQGGQQRGGSDCVSDSDRDGVDTFLEGDDARLDMNTLAAAKRVADRYNKECGKRNKDSAPPLGQMELTAQVTAAIPLSSTSSVDNTGTDHIFMVPTSSKQQPNLTTHPHEEDESQGNAPDRQNADDSSSSSSSGSDSGDEEIVEEVSFGVAPVGTVASSDGRTTTNSSSGPPSQGSENERSKSSSAKSAQPRSSSPSRCTNDSASVESSSASEGDGSKEKVILEQSGFTSLSASTTIKSQASATQSLDKDASSFQTDPAYVDVKQVLSNGTISPPPSARPSLQPSLSSSSLMQVQETLDLTPLRPRYVGSNRDLAYKFISDALEERLRHKTKQNSRLLSTLPSFAAVPRVRSLATGHLERWLQSPALSGLARSLFSSIVSSMRNVDPPLKEDINAIDDILSMKLKANQLSAHIENVTSIARNVPTPRVSKHLFLHLFREELNGNIFLPKEESSSSIVGAKAPPTSDALRMAVAVHDSLPKDLASEAMASAILSLAAEVPVPTTARQSTKGSSSSSPHQPRASSPVAVTNEERSQHIFAVRCLIRNVSAALGTSYDGRALVASLLASDGHPHGASWPSYVDWLDDVARLAWESATLIAPIPASSLAGVGAAAATQRQKSMVPRRVSGECVFANRPAPALDVGELDPEDLSTVSCALLATRKVFLCWCVGTYTRAFLSSTQQDEEAEMVDSFPKERSGENKRSKRGKTGKMKSVARSNSRPAAGAGPPDFGSILDGQSLSGEGKIGSGVPVQGRLHHVVSTIHCLLFLTEPDSSKLLSFLSPWNQMTKTPSSPTTQNCFTHCDQPVQVSLCSSYGCDVDDDIIRIILASAASHLDGLDVSLAFSLLDDILLKCQAGSTSFLRVSDSDIVWELYELTEYQHRNRDRGKRESEEKAREEGTISINPVSYAMESVRMIDAEQQQPSQKEHNVNCIPKNDDTAEFVIPRIAYPGLWWRATAISLVLCGSSPQKIGLSMWKMNPTIQALMKMSISDRYRFPTIDCDEDAREAMKRGEAEAREMESNIAAKLFLPKPEVKRIAKDDASSAPFYSGARVSARQREKQAKVLSQQRRKEEAAALAEVQRRRRLVKEAQKTIMLLDPRSTARKPPKDVVGLFLSINELFGLPDHFRQCTDPDFLVKTFDSTSRESIERAYDWLIPIISSHPDVIDRLPPGASCFLLLRAYGTDGDSKSGQLLELSSPLLRHVSSCLKGSLGEADAVRAADLLLADISDRSPDRRRCARRVLQEAIGSVDTTGPRKFAKTSSNRVLPALHSNCDWLFDFVDVKHASILLPNVINCVSCALAFERGGILRAYILALHRYTEFVTDRNIKVAFDFVRTLCELLSARSHVCSATMDRFHDFRDLALAVVHHELEERIARGVTKENASHQQDDEGLSVKLCVWEHHSSFSDEKKQVRESIVDLSLLEAAIVLLSNWQDDLDIAIEGNESIFNEPQNEHVRALTRYLIFCPDDNLDDASLCGAAGATFVHNKKRALSVEEWTMLAKSRCAFIARHAALSAPVLFLPRLLLCCGLPRTSFSAMLERLGKLGDSSEEPAKRFKELLSPSATSEWGVSHIGNRRAIARKLLGRITAYMRHLRDQSKCVQGSDLEAAFKSSFVLWLAAECEDVRVSSSGSADKSKRRTPKKGVMGHGGSKCTSAVPEHLRSISDAKFRISRTSLAETSESHEYWSDHDEDIGIDWGAGIQVKESELKANSSTLSETLITSCCGDGGNTLALESRLKLLFHEKVHTSLQSPYGTSQQDSNGSEEDDAFNRDMHVVAQQILSSLPSRSTVPSSFVAFLMKWIPLLTQSFGNASLWKVLFTSSMHSNAKVEKSCQEVLDMLVSRCAEVWCDDHVRSCQRWILSGRVESEKLWNTRAVSFLLMTSQQRSFHLSFMGTKIPMAPFVCIESDTLAEEAIRLALECSETSDDSMVSARESHEAVDISTPSSSVSGVSGRLCARNRLPDFLTLILLIAQSEKSLCQLVVRLLLDQLSSFPTRRKVVEAVVLRLYAYYPTYVSLGDLRLRETLLDAAACYASSWLKWRSLYDEQAHTMILSLAKNPNQRLLQAVSDFAKQHPLLLARQFTPLVEVLEGDGLPASQQSAVEKRGRIYASMYTFATANTYYGMVRVKPRHWGDSFTESLWVSVLDVLGSIPDEVTYHPCSREMGLLKLLGVYVKLIATQARLKNYSDTSRLKLKFIDELSSFQQSNKREFNEWVEGKIEDIEEWGTVREVLASCGVKVSEIQNAAATNPPVQNGQNVAR